MEKYRITEKILKLNLTNNDIDAALDNFCDQIETDKDKEVLTSYALQCFFRSGKDSFTEEELLNKISNLILDRIAFSLEQAGYVESTIDEDGEVLYTVTNEGVEYLNDNI